MILGRAGIIGGERRGNGGGLNGNGKTTAGRHLRERTGEMEWVSGWEYVLWSVVSRYSLLSRFFLEKGLEPMTKKVNYYILLLVIGLNVLIVGTMGYKASILFGILLT